MYNVIETEAFADWVDGLRDIATAQAMAKEINL